MEENLLLMILVLGVTVSLLIASWYERRKVKKEYGPLLFSEPLNLLYRIHRMLLLVVLLISAALVLNQEVLLDVNASFILKLTIFYFFGLVICLLVKPLISNVSFYVNGIRYGNTYWDNKKIDYIEIHKHYIKVVLKTNGSKRIYLACMDRKEWDLLRNVSVVDPNEIAS